jgi:hypothetical protein
MRVLLEWHMEINVLSPLMRMFCFLPLRVAPRDDSGAAEGVGRLAGREAGVAAKVPTVAAGGGGAAGARTRCS